MDFEKRQSSKLWLKAFVRRNSFNIMLAKRNELHFNEGFLVLGKSLMPKREIQLPERPYSVTNRRYLPIALIKPLPFVNPISENKFNQSFESDELDESAILDSLL